jgi:hypothetical protein
VTVHTYLGLISHHTPVDPDAAPYPAVILPTTPEWDLVGREVLVIRDPDSIDPLEAVMATLAPLADGVALRVLDAARARVELTPEALGVDPAREAGL